MNDSVNSAARITESDWIPYWRIVLRGCSQLCFQSNEWTGLLFVMAVLVASPISAAYLLVAAIIAPAGRLLLEKKAPTLTTGLPGLNPCLIAISLPAFFHTGWTNVGMWMVLLVCVVSAVLLVRLFVAVFPFPILVFPFLIVFWILYALAPRLDILQPIAIESLQPSSFHPLTAVLSSLGQAVFSASIWSGLLFATGLFSSNWRHGMIAVLGAVIGTGVSYYYHDADPASANLGLYGFNGVLTAVSVFVFCGGKLRLSILGALVATILTPAIAAFGVQALSAPFVITTWIMLALGWVEDHWFALPMVSEPTAATSSTLNAKSQFA
jgi:urea transporter